MTLLSLRNFTTGSNNEKQNYQRPIYFCQSSQQIHQIRNCLLHTHLLSNIRRQNHESNCIFSLLFRQQLGPVPTIMIHYLFMRRNDDIIYINFNPYKAKRMCLSAMVGVILSSYYLFDCEITLAHEVITLLNHVIHLNLFTDSKSLFDKISKVSRTSENTEFCTSRLLGKVINITKFLTLD